MKRLWYSPTLRSMALLGAAGLGFAGANLILARVMPTAEYAMVTLVVALVNLGVSFAPLGADEMVNRLRLDPAPRLLTRVLLATGFVGLVFAVIADLGYDMSPAFLAMLFVSITAGGVMIVAGAQFQSEQRFGISLGLNQSSNLVLLLAALVVVASKVYEAWLPVLIGSIGFVLFAAGGWLQLLHERRHKPHRRTSFSFTEALALAGINAAGLLLIQLERLVIPYVLTIHDLATYGVLAAIAGSLFRVLQMGVGYSLIPRLRAADSVAERRRLIAHEVWLAGTIAVGGAAVIWIATPFIERHLLDGKYHLPAALLVAAIVSGVAKILNAFAKATVTALAEPREVKFLNLLGWISAVIAIGAAVVGARWGLAGVIYGVTLGWLIRAVSAFYVTFRHLHLPAAAPAATPAAASAAGERGSS